MAERVDVATSSHFLGSIGRLSVLLGLALLALQALACSPTGLETPTPVRWAKSYATTTCDDWLTQMDHGQRTQMAGELLHQLDVEHRWSSPPDVAVFELRIGDYCRQPRDNLVAAFGERVHLVSSGAGLIYGQMLRESSEGP
jgi:hypothetical protein